MSPEKQRIAIAAFVWEHVDCPHWARSIRAAWEKRNELPMIWCGIPDYLNDLNAMHGAENVLTDEQRVAYSLQWLPCVLTINGRTVRPKREEFTLIHATAAQRAEAFLRTIGKWGKQ